MMRFIIYVLVLIIVLISVYESNAYSDIISPTFYCHSTDFCQKCGFKGHVACENTSRGKQCVCINDSVYRNEGCFKEIKDKNEKCSYNSDCALSGQICEEGICDCPKGTILINKQCKEMHAGQPCYNNLDCNIDKGLRCNQNSICSCKENHVFYNDNCVPYNRIARSICVSNKDCKNGYYCRIETNFIFGECTLNKAYLGEKCDIDEQCYNEKPGSICQHGFCACDNNYVNRNGECVSKHLCFNNQDCQNKMENSFCDRQTSTCKCAVGTISIGASKCIPRHGQIGDYCKSEKDCLIGFCNWNTDDYGTCTCEENKIYYNGTCLQLPKPEVIEIKQVTTEVVTEAPVRKYRHPKYQELPSLNQKNEQLQETTRIIERADRLQNTSASTSIYSSNLSHFTISLGLLICITLCKKILPSL